MDERVKYWAFVFLAVRFAIDVTLALLISYREGDKLFGIVYMIMASPFLLLLFFGFKNEVFHGRNRAKIYADEGFIYWFCAGFIIVFHLFCTVMMTKGFLW